MAKFTTLTPTIAGKVLQARLISAGQAVNITEIVVGSGELDEETDVRQLTELIEPVEDADITLSKKTYDSSGNLIIEIMIKSSETEYPLREIGVKMKNPFNNTNVLMSYAHSLDDGDVIPALSESPVVTYITLIIPQDGTEIDVSIEVTAGVSHQEFEAHVGNTDNPHEVKFAQTVETLEGGADVDYIDDGLYRYPANTDNAPTADEGLLMQITPEEGGKFQIAVKAAQDKVGIYQRYYAIPDGGSDYEWTAWASTLESPAFTGTPTAPTAASGTSTAQLATTAFVMAAINEIYAHIPEDQSEYAHSHSNKTVLDSITQSVVTNSHSHSNKSVLDGITSTLVSRWNSAYVDSHSHSNKDVLDDISSTDISNWNSKASASHTHSQYAPKASPAFSGTPTAPTPDVSNNSTRIATTEFVQSVASDDFNTTPQKIGTWIDGTPVWRAAFKAPITDTMKIGKACSIFYDLSFVKSAESVKLVIGGSACIDIGSVVDNNTTTLDAFGCFNWDSINPIAEYISGYIDFITPADNIKS